MKDHGLDVPVQQQEFINFLALLELVRPDVFQQVIERIEQYIAM
jgi:hypothetical protein